METALEKGLNWYINKIRRELDDKFFTEKLKPKNQENNNPKGKQRPIENEEDEEDEEGEIDPNTPKFKNYEEYRQYLKSIDPANKNK